MALAPRRPEHAGLFEAGADHGFAARLDHAGADEQVLSAELRDSACDRALLSK